MLKHLYKTAFFMAVGFLSLQNAKAQQTCPSESTLVSNDTVCSGQDSSSIYFSKVEIGAKYKFYRGDVLVDSAVADGHLRLAVSNKKLSIGSNKLTVKILSKGCPTVTLQDSAMVLINRTPGINQRVVGDTICDNETSATIKIYGTIPGESYKTTINGMTISQMLAKTDILFLTIPRSALSLGINTISIHASVAGCGTFTLANQAIVRVNPIPMAASFVVTGDTICSTNPFAKITIMPSSKSISYQIFSGTMALTDPFFGDPEKDFTVKNISTEALAIGKNLITVKTTIDMGQCGGMLSLKATATVVIHPTPEPPSLKLTGDTVFVTEKFAIVKIQNSPVGQKYMFQSSQMRDTSIAAEKPTVELKIPVGAPNGLPVGVHTIFLNSKIAGCLNLTIRDSIVVVVKKDPTLSNENYFINSNFSVWPNPFSSELHVASKLTGNVNVQIVDALGNVMHQQTTSANEEIKINPDLKSGLYFLQMESDGKRELVKLIKQ